MNGHPIIDPRTINKYDFDRIIISLDDLKEGNEGEILKIYDQLRDMDIPDHKIVLQSFKYMQLHKHHTPRVQFLKNLSELFSKQHIDGAVAECGVYRGWFSAMINECFPDRKLYLFDTFTGFDHRDILCEDNAAKQWLLDGGYNRLREASEEMVRLRCPSRSSLIIRKGYVPDTFYDIEDRFAFVNLDMDLYVPQIAALRFFAPRMNPNGVILLHDYFNESLPGTRKAVEEFEKEHPVSKFPIGDGLSIVLFVK